MHTRRKIGVLAIIIVLVFSLVTLSLFFETPYTYATQYFGDNLVIVGVVYIFFIIIATVIAPLAALPLAPAISILIGPFLTAILSIIGWTLGAIIAFLIARNFGRPVLSRFVDIKRVEKYESYIPKQHTFIWLIFLRMIIPVDILSYAIGFLSTIQLRTYSIATAIGVSPFAFIFVYGGNALLEKHYGILLLVVVAGLSLFISSIYFYRRRNKNEII